MKQIYKLTHTQTYNEINNRIERERERERAILLLLLIENKKKV